MYCKVKGKNLDWEYIKKQCKVLEIDDFEQKRRALSVKIFSSDIFPELTEDEYEMFMNYMMTGTYGTIENYVKKQLETQSKLSFWLHKIFISREQMEKSVPFTSKSPLLYPVGLVWRCGRVMIKLRGKLKQVIKAVNKYGK